MLVADQGARGSGVATTGTATVLFSYPAMSGACHYLLTTGGIARGHGHTCHAVGMARVTLTDECLVVALNRWERAYAWSGDLKLRWSHIDRAQFSTDPWLFARGWRVPAGIPGLFLLGRMRHRDGRDFVALVKRDPGVILELHDEPYRQVVVSMDESTAREIVRRVTES